MQHAIRVTYTEIRGSGLLHGCCTKAEITPGSLFLILHFPCKMRHSEKLPDLDSNQD
jgi:hypothetical protein